MALFFCMTFALPHVVVTVMFAAGIESLASVPAESSVTVPPPPLMNSVASTTSLVVFAMVAVPDTVNGEPILQRAVALRRERCSRETR